MLNKKADAAVVVLVIILVIIIIAWLINMSGRECRNDKGCNQYQYCGSDFKCHDKEVIEKIVVKNNLVKPSIILGTALIIAAGIIRWRRG